MSLSRLLLIDDSEAVLAYERAALGDHYQLVTATDGVEGLARAAEVQPDAILLDLSMPKMDGDEVLRRLKADTRLREIPVIIVSSEQERGEQAIAAGAVAFVRKPVQADALRALVARVLADRERERERGSAAVLVAHAGPHRLAIPLEAVREVVDLPATRPLPFGPFHLREAIELRGEPVLVLNVPRRLGCEHEVAVLERKLVVVHADGLSLALAVDRVRDPEVIPSDQVRPSRALGGASEGPLERCLRGMVQTGEGAVPLIEPSALVSPALLRRLAGQLREQAR